MNRAGGIEAFKIKFPLLVRQAIDEIIDTIRTGQVHADELEKTEKTYIGTKIEITVRNFFKLPRGVLDLRIGNRDVDVKFTVGRTWMIPPEAAGNPCILVASDEARRTCYFGLLIARHEYLTNAANRDAKLSVSTRGFDHIDWILQDEPYPEGFWSSIGKEITKKIMEGRSGAERMRRLV